MTKRQLIARLKKLHAKASSAPWTFCDLEPKKLFPHVHLGAPDHNRTYLSGDGKRYPAVPRYLTINEGVPPGEKPEDWIGTTHETCVANGTLIVEMRNMIPELIELLEGKCGSSTPRGRRK